MNEGDGPLGFVKQYGFWLLVGGIVLVLASVYWALVRTTYDPILTNIAPQDAVDVVKVLDEQKIPYKLADQGTTILVDSSVADKARVQLVGSELPMRGQVGFELFNKSDMGLTEFDQKINYQRALQGELSRTILMLDGISQVRVHLGLPDQTAFRDEQGQAKASVTLILKPGATLTEARVRGIQRLVAGAVPQMLPDAVAVLDGTGRVVSADTAASPTATTSGDKALDDVKVRLNTAIHTAFPALNFMLNISYGASADQAAAGRDGSSDADSDAQVSTGQWGAYSVRLTTPQQLDTATIAGIKRVGFAQGLDPTHGDTLNFAVGPVVATTVDTAAATTSDRVVTRATAPRTMRPATDWLAFWPWALILALLALGLAFWRDRRRTAACHSEDLESFTAQLRARLHASENAP